MSKKNWLICFGYHWSDKAVYGMGNIAIEFYNDNKRVLWINPIPNRSLKLNSTGSNKKVFLKRIFRKLKKQLKFVRIKNKNFIILTPIYLPFLSSPKIKTINEHLVGFQIKIFLFILGIKKTLIYSSGPNTPVKFIKKREYLFWFHNVGDLFHDLRNIDSNTRSSIYKKEKEIFNNVDLLLVASKITFNKVQKMVNNKEKVKLFSHGADFKHFSKPKLINNKIKNIKKPIVGYFGSLTEANDQQAIIYLAKAGYNVVLIGEVLADYSACKDFNNVYFLGAIDYQQLPCYAQYFDIGILNWKPAEWIRNCNPKKTYEYFSLGIPVVSVKIPQLENEFGDLIYFVEESKDFPAKVRLALNENNSEIINKRKLKAKSQSWNVKYKQLKKYIIDGVN